MEDYQKECDLFDLSKIVEDEDRVLISEAIDLYETGHYRASFLFAWLSCAESLKRRFISSAYKDNQMQQIINKIEKTEENNASIDFLLINSSQDVGFITKAEKEKLVYFYNMRCIYSHPNQVAPTALDCEHIIKSILDLVLYKDVLLGAVAVSEIIEKILSENAFLSTSTSEIDNYVKSFIKRVNPKIYNYTFNILLKKFSQFQKEDSNSPNFYRLKQFLISYIESLGLEKILNKKHCEESLNDLRLLNQRSKEHKNENIENRQRLEISSCHKYDFDSIIVDNKLFSIEILSIENIYKCLDERSKSIVLRLLIEESCHRKISNLLELSLISDKNEDLVNFFNKISSSDLIFYKAPFIIEILVKRLNSSIFSLQNPIAYLFFNAEFAHSLSNCSEDDLFELGRAIVSAANDNSFDIIHFLNWLQYNTEMYPYVNLLNGMFYQLFYTVPSELHIFKDGIAQLLVYVISKYPPDFVNQVLAELEKHLECVKTISLNSLSYNFLSPIFDKYIEKAKNRINSGLSENYDKSFL